jgi:hypothetical protein
MGHLMGIGIAVNTDEKSKKTISHEFILVATKRTATISLVSGQVG